MLRKKTWKELKAKQKARISEWMFRIVCDYYREHDKMPEGDDLEELAQVAFEKVQGYRITYETAYKIFMKKQKRFAERIERNGLWEPKPPRVKKTEEEKLAIKRAERKRKKAKKKAAKKKAQERERPLFEQDQNFYMIVGYTDGGAPYGVTWEDMGLEPWEEPRDSDFDL